MTNVGIRPKLKVALLLNRRNFARSFAPETISRLESFAEILNTGELPLSIDEGYVLKYISQAEAVITCWGTPKLEGSILRHATNLRVIAHAAGTPKAIINEKEWPDGIRIVTAAPIIAIDVAEAALWAMIDQLKQMNEFDRRMRTGDWFTDLSGLKDVTRRLNYRLKVGIVSASHVGRNMIRLLRSFGVQIALYDPFVSESEALKLGVLKTTLEQLFSTSDVVSIHAPSLPATQGMITKALIQSLTDGAVFINTSRGPIIDEAALIDELRTGRIRAYLDVFFEEPLPMTSELHRLPNVRLSPHMSGGHTINGSYERGDYIVQQLFAFHSDGTLLDEVTKDRIDILA